MVTGASIRVGLVVAAAALMVTSTTAPALLVPEQFLGGAWGAAPLWATGAPFAPLPPLGLDPAAGAGPDGPGATTVPSFDGRPPAAQAFGVYVGSLSGMLAGGAPTAGPSPLAEAETQNGYGDQLAVTEDLWVRDIDGDGFLVDATALRAYAVARTLTGPVNSKGIVPYYAAQARAESHVEWAELLDGDILVRGLTSEVFASANQFNHSLPVRLETGRTAIRELRVMGTPIPITGQLDGSLTYNMPGIGTLYVNETVEAIGFDGSGSITNYGLRLHLNANNLDIIIGAATAKVARQPLAPRSECTTWVDAYPEASQVRAGDDHGMARHNWVLGDPPQGITKLHGYVSDVPVDNFATIVRPGVAVAEGDALATTEGASAHAQSSITAINLLNGLVTADEVRGVAHAEVVHTPNQTSAAVNADGSTLVNLKVGSLPPIEATPDPNTHYPVMVGDDIVADLWVNERTTQVVNNGTVQIALQRTNMLRLVVTTHNLLPNLPYGTQIILGHAIAIAACGTELPPRNFGDPLGIASSR